jgi:hypothetical protein
MLQQIVQSLKIYFFKFYIPHWFLHSFITHTVLPHKKAFIDI